MNKWALWLIVFLFSSAYSDDYLKQTSVDVAQYNLKIDLNQKENGILASCQIDFFAQDSLSSLSIDFSDMNVDSILLNAHKINYILTEEKIILNAPQYISKNKLNRLTVFYHGVPKDGLYLGTNKYGAWVAFADNWPNRAHYWFPCIDHPYDKARVSFKITCPETLNVIANGIMIDRMVSSEGKKTVWWYEARDIPTYCMVFGAAKFSVVEAGIPDKIPLYYYLFPQDVEKGKTDFARASEIVNLYTQLIAPFPYEKLALVQSATRFGGMENSSAIFFPEKGITGKNQLTATVAHEIAHQWFGDEVTEADWHHLWLSEGFATYFGTLFFQWHGDNEQFKQKMRQQKRRIFAYQKEHGPRPIVDESITNLFKLLNPNNYSKGSWVLHMLRGLLGDDKFFATCRTYYEKFKGKNALTGDFQKIAEQFYGKPLDWFFKQWVYGSGYPILKFRWHWNAEEKVAEISIEQLQTTHLFKFPCVIQFIYPDNTHRETVWIDQSHHEFNFKTSSQPLNIIIDPDEWLLMQLVTEDK